MKLRRLDTRDAGFEPAFERLRLSSAEADPEIDTRVAAILADVRARGDAAVLEYTARFDALEASSVAGLALGADEMRAAYEAITRAQRNALQSAAARIRSYHERSSTPAGALGVTATTTARCWGRRSRRWIAWASTCRVARPRTRRAC